MRSVNFDELVNFSTKHAEKQMTADLLSEWFNLTMQIESSLKLEYENQNRSIKSNTKVYESITQIRLIGAEEPTDDNFDSSSYKTELSIGIKESMKKFPEHMPFPGGFIGVVYLFTYKSCLLVDQHNLYVKKQITDEEFWHTLWLFFYDPNRDDLENIEKISTDVLEKCESRSRKLHSEKKKDSLIDDEKRVRFHYKSEPHKGKKFFCTFPYPYQNGTLHLGHAYTILKAEFQARFRQLLGENILFPFGFHGTGMPIVACANKLKESLANLQNDLSKIDINSLEKDNQIRILFNMNVKTNEIPSFVDPYHWLRYFPEKNTSDVGDLGTLVDFRRSFVTTDVNQYYDSFVKWQFKLLNERSYLKFGKKPIIYSPKDKQPCADHDRKQGCEGIDPLEMKMIKIKCEDLLLFVTVDSKNFESGKKIKSIVVNKNEPLYFIKLQDEKDVIVNKTFVDNYKHQSDKSFDFCEAFNSSFLIGKTVEIGTDKFVIQSSENYVNGSGIKLYFYADDSISQDQQKVKLSDVLPKNDTFIYYEPEKEVISRTGDICVVAITDQWFLDYSDAKLKEKINHYITNQFSCEGIKTDLLNASNWITFWPCSRSYGLGTKLLDTEYLIDSLSDSTIYMAYYTISHKIEQLPIEALKHDVWNYIFAITDDKPNIEHLHLDFIEELRSEFLYWYPMDMRVSGKDLIGNHLIMCLYNHFMIWGDDKMMPKMYFVNGHLKLNGEKMSKSTGNFMTLNQALSNFGINATRFTLAGAGSNLDDGNFTNSNTKEAILCLYNEREWCIDCIAQIQKENGNSESDVWNDIFETEINECLNSVKELYNKLDYQKVIVCGFYKMISIRDKQRVRIESGLSKFSSKHMRHYIENFLLILYPICPHFVETLWNYGNCDIGFSKTWPINNIVNLRHIYFRDVFNDLVSEINSSVTNMEKRLAKKGEKKNFDVKVTIITSFSDIEQQIIAQHKDNKTANEIMKHLSGIIKDKKLLGLSGKFVGYVQSRIQKYGQEWYDYVNITNYELLSTNVVNLYKANSKSQHKIENISFEHKEGSSDTLFKNNPESPIIKIS